MWLFRGQRRSRCCDPPHARLPSGTLGPMHVAFKVGPNEELSVHVNPVRRSRHVLALLATLCLLTVG